MPDADVYLSQIRGMSNYLTQRTSDISEEQFAERPGPSLNPVRWNYFHILRVWDMDLNVLAQERPPSDDAWHRGEFTAKSGYSPDGKGIRGIGIGTGYSDADVDELSVSREVLDEYHAMLLAETEHYLSQAGDEDFKREVQGIRGMEPIGARFQHIVGHSWMHIGELGYAKGVLGYHDQTYPASS